MMGAPFWDDQYNAFNPGPYRGSTYAPNAWDTGKIKGVQLPGLVSVNASRSRHLDIKQLPGSSPIVTAVGYEPLRFTMSIRIWTPAQWDVLQQIMAFLQTVKLPGLPKGAPAPQSVFDVYHPALSALSVSSAMCLSLGPITGGQDKTLTIGMLEKRKGTTPVAPAGPSASVAAPYDAAALASQSVSAANGKTTTFTPAQGPVVPPSQGGVTLTPTL